MHRSKAHWWWTTGNNRIAAPPALAPDAQHRPKTGDIYVFAPRDGSERQIWVFDSQGKWSPLPANAGTTAIPEIQHPAKQARWFSYPLGKKPDWLKYESFSRKLR